MGADRAVQLGDPEVWRSGLPNCLEDPLFKYRDLPLPQSMVVRAALRFRSRPDGDVCGG
jgi:hypothetical protein